MTITLYRLGRFCAVHAKLVIVAWIIAGLLLIIAGNRLGAPTNDSLVVNGTDSAVAQTLLKRAFPTSSAEASRVVLSVSSGKLTDDAHAAAVSEVVNALKGLPGVAAVGDPLDAGSKALSPDERTGYISITPDGQSTRSKALADQVLNATDPAAEAGIDVAVGGQLGQELSRSPVRNSEIIGILMAVIVLLLAFGSAVAMGVPIVTAILSVGSGLAVLSLLGTAVDLPAVARTLSTMIGLGVGIDYGLFLVVRFRRLLARGLSTTEAVGRTAGSSGSAVLFAGGTVTVALCGLGLSGVSFVGWLGYSAAIVVAVSVLSALTLTPALLGWLGPRIDRLSLPGRRNAGIRDRSADELERTRWARFAGWVARRPWTIMLSTSALLVVLAVPVAAMHLGQMDAGQLPASTESRRAYDALAAGFGPGANGPLRTVVELHEPAAAPSGTVAESGIDPRALDPRLVALQTTIAGLPEVSAVDTPVISPDGAIAVLGVTQSTSPSDQRTVQLVDDLRDTVLPQALAGKGATGHVGGLTATKADLAARIAERLPWLICGVVLLSGVLMLLAFRSIWLAVKAAAMNLISIAAAYGVVVAVFQWGWGIGLIGLDGPVPIESYVPMMMFAILFGLSMDYEIFLLTSIQEHWHATGDNTRAVRLGLADTGQIISSAALIMVAVFASFLINSNPVVKMAGLGLSVAVAVDATIVRCLLVPAAMVLFGQRQWHLPARLDALLPRIAIDPDPAVFDGRRTSRDVDSRIQLGTGATVERRGTGIVSGILVSGTAVFAAAHAGSFVSAIGSLAPLLLGALVAVMPITAVTGVPSAAWTRTLGIGTSVLARATGLCIGVVAAIAAAMLAIQWLPPIPSATGVSVAVALALSSAVPVLTRGRIPLIATWAGTLAFAIAWAAASVTASSAPSADIGGEAIEQIAAGVMLWAAIGLTVTLLGRALGRIGSAAIRAPARRPDRNAPGDATWVRFLQGATTNPMTNVIPPDYTREARTDKTDVTEGKSS